MNNMGRAHLLVVLLFFITSVYAQQRSKVQVAFYNLENLFDTLDSPGVDDESFTPLGSKSWNRVRYQNKLDKLSKVILDMGKSEGFDTGPSIIGLCEVENHLVLRDLITSHRLKKSNYRISHFDSPDRRGIDVALLYRNNSFNLISAQAKAVYLHDPVNGTRIYTRDILLVKGEVNKEVMYLMVNHWPSRWGGRTKSQPNRIAAAGVARHLADSILKADSLANIIVMGDFNDDPDNISLTEYLHAGPELAKVNKKQLYNSSYPLFVQGMGTLKYRGNWNLFDQIILSQGLTDSVGLNHVATKIFKPDYLFQAEGKYAGYPLRTYGGRTYLNGYSDHLPTYILLK